MLNRYLLKLIHFKGDFFYLSSCQNFSMWLSFKKEREKHLKGVFSWYKLQLNNPNFATRYNMKKCQNVVQCHFKVVFACQPHMNHLHWAVTWCTLQVAHVVRLNCIGVSCFNACCATFCNSNYGTGWTMNMTLMCLRLSVVCYNL